LTFIIIFSVSLFNILSLKVSFFLLSSSHFFPFHTCHVLKSPTHRERSQTRTLRWKRSPAAWQTFHLIDKGVPMKMKCCGETLVKEKVVETPLTTQDPFFNVFIFIQLMA
jgi:hypothetical protein